MTVRVVGQVSLASGANDADKQSIARGLGERATGLDGVAASHVGIHAPGSVGGGELTWDLLLRDAAAVEAFCARLAGADPSDVVPALGWGNTELASRIQSIELAIPETLEAHTHAPGLVGVKRTLWLRVLPEADPRAIERFERETPLLAAAVPAIRNWRWSRVRTSRPRPMATRWTHLWEQEFESVEGLQVDYMSSPCHWGYIDRWFDPEMPDRVVDLWLAHLFCPESAPVLSWDGSPQSSRAPSREPAR